MKCVIFDRICNECGECDICDLDESKICDSCGKCIETDADFKVITIDNVILED